MIRHDIIKRRFIEGLSVAELCKRYTLAEWEVEAALRTALVEKAQAEIDFAAPAPPAADPAQTTIAEVYGEITV